MVSLTFLGSGDAFGSGGRLQACFLLDGPAGGVLVDCGTTALPAMKRAGIDPGGIGTVLISHLHGDHFGGLPFLILDGQFSRRALPLTVAGPAGVAARVRQAQEVLFPGSAGTRQRFALDFVELGERRETAVGPVRVTAFPVVHPSGAPPLALRVQYGDRVLAYSGDTEWTDALLEAAEGADLFVCEAYRFDRRVPYHLDWATLRANLDRLRCRRVVLTHLSQDMLARRGEVDLPCAEDGLRLTL
jgi:ribonuclease BN (tRNA processing enzyme)